MKITDFRILSGWIEKYEPTFKEQRNYIGKLFLRPSQKKAKTQPTL